MKLWRYVVTLAFLSISSQAWAQWRTAEAQDLLGRWSAPPLADDSMNGTFKVSQTFAADGQHSFEVLAQSQTPLGRSRLYKIVLRGEYRDAGPLPPYRALDRRYTSRWLTLLTKDTVEQANESKECGVNNWQVGKPLDITQRQCKSVMVDVAMAEWIKDIWALDAKGSLYFGATDGDDISVRPQDIDREVVFARSLEEFMPSAHGQLATVLTSIRSHSFQPAATSLLGSWTTLPFPDETGMATLRYMLRFEPTGEFRFDGLIQLRVPIGKSVSKLSYTGRYDIVPVTGMAADVAGLDLHFQRELVTEYNQNQVDQHNEKRECGYDNWRVGVPQDITGRTCKMLEGDVSFTVPYKTIFAVRDQRLLTGMDIHGGEWSHERDTALREDVVFERSEDALSGGQP